MAVNLERRGSDGDRAAPHARRAPYPRPWRVVDARPVHFLLDYVRERRWGFGLLAASVIGAGVCAVAVQYGMKLIVDAMSVGARADADIWSPLALFMGMIALESVLWRVGGWLGCRTVLGACVDMRVDLFQHLSGHSMRYFAEHLSGALGNRITATAGAAGAIFSTTIWSIVPPVVDFLGAVVLLIGVDPRLALVLTVFVLGAAFAIFRFGIRGRPLHVAYGEEAARVNGEIVDTVANVWTVKAFSGRAREQARLADAFADEALAQRRSWMFIEKTRVLHDVALWVLAGTMLAWTLRAWQAGALTPGDVVLVSALTFRILHGARDLALSLVGVSQHVGVIAETLRVIAQPHAIGDAAPTGEAGSPRRGDIEFDNVAFRYPGAPRLFEHFRLIVPAGQKLGIMGPSGSGKSTLLGLIQRLEDVQAGRILIDGQPVSHFTQDGLRAGIAVVPQDVSLFRRSVMENLRYGNPQASDEQVYDAARAAYCDGFIRALPQGYDTVVGERGATLSGGQRQRIAIARALLKQAPILILDEATSALDRRAEAEVQAALRELMAGRTVVAVAHRVSTLSSFDRIIVLRDGHIVEDDTPAALSERNLLSGRH